MKSILGRVWATLVILGIIGFLSAPSLAASLPSAPFPKPSHSEITFIKITDGTDIEIVDTAKSPLVLDKQGYRYEPAGEDKQVPIAGEVRIAADNISFSNAVIDGDLYINGNNARLYGLTVKGTVYIVSGQDAAMDNCSVVSGKVEMLDAVEANIEADVEANADAFGEFHPQPVFADNSVTDWYDRIDESPEISPDVTGKPAVALLESVAIDDFNSRYVVTNKNRVLPADWKPKDLTPISVPYHGRREAKYLRREACDALAMMFAGAKKEGIVLCGVSGFRSYELQKSVYNKYSRQLGEKAADMVSAKAGNSEHQTGLAVDISSKSLNYTLSNSFANTREGKWLAANAAKYGFILRYPKGKEAITGYVYEPWHFRYIGAELAADMAKKSITLEEYYGIAPEDIGQNLIAGVAGNKVDN
ncbi:MAG TPA: M15 family metallopeptidase [Clostridia bacterium]|nr:M15 family metallopeptidase [Clostridia bacterium]